jgi:hypothetical protein
MAIKTFTPGEVLTASDTNIYLANSGYVLVKNQAVGGSSVATLTVTDAFSATYKNYKIVVSGTTSSAGGNWFTFQFLAAHTTGYYGASRAVDYLGNTIEQSRNNAASLLVSRNSGILGYDGFTVDVYNPFVVSASAVSSAGSGNVGYVISGGIFDAATSFSQFVIGVSGGTFSGGNIAVYGLRD